MVERYVYTPYGEVMVHQESSFGDRDGDKDVDANDKGVIGVACPGTVTGACRILDLDFDGDFDEEDNWSGLKKGYMRHPGRLASQVGMPFLHQGLFYDPETSTYQNRARQYSPTLRRLLQRDPLNYIRGPNLFEYVSSNPARFRDPSGLDRWVLDDGLHRYMVIGPIDGEYYMVDLVGEGNNQYDNGLRGAYGWFKDHLHALFGGWVHGVVEVVVPWYESPPFELPRVRSTTQEDRDLLNDMLRHPTEFWHLFLYNCGDFCENWVYKDLLPFLPLDPAPNLPAPEMGPPAPTPPTPRPPRWPDADPRCP